MNSTDLPVLTHREAVLDVYRYTPQIKDYDRFMHCGARWLPYTMYFHEKNFVSDAINTDMLGFRFAHFCGRRYSVAELPYGAPVSLLVGGSTALGVGACSDEATLASRLAVETGEIWLNFAGRGFNAMQELIMFLMHQGKFSRINRVALLSGVNTLALEGIPEEFSSDHGRYYYSFEFQHYMNLFNEDMKRKKNSFNVIGQSRASVLSRLKFWERPGENPADRVIDDSTVTLDERIERAAAQIAKALRQWALLLADFKIRPIFFLQPLSYWCEKEMTREERGVFHAIDSCPNNFYRLFSKVLGKEVHQPFFEAIRCKTNDIVCHDMNQLLRSSPSMKETLFVDRVHFNDLGNAELGRLMAPLV
ncbi:hypothetical protein ACFFJT_05275 [Dyella flava]|uniref:SGNH/GDSL hydrolase family protein n=1 Tax=Dyella flava TaxID=1920170 RepID=A0ABS2K6G5_9GAMM|nr:hypothetical protein [Dyella flava]MBM7126766.1 SGNH/GDSL hydrolase family protein [Dyella flava]GLQ49411.1 hypothetical protein GCM10010872_08600 [Dyella flava]